MTLDWDINSRPVKVPSLLLGQIRRAEIQNLVALRPSNLPILLGELIGERRVRFSKDGII